MAKKRYSSVRNSPYQPRQQKSGRSLTTKQRVNNSFANICNNVVNFLEKGLDRLLTDVANKEPKNEERAIPDKDIPAD